MRNNLGTIRVLFNRIKADVSIVNLLMIGYLFISEAGFHWYYLLIIPCLFVDLWLHSKKLVRQEWDYYFQKSKEFQELKNDIKEIKEKI